MSPDVSDALARWADPRLAAAEDALGRVFSGVEPAPLREACRYPLDTGGKRIRPLLALAACEAVGADWRVAVPAAVAVELVHTYSLVHDDLPCMDDDAERRGRPTAHVVYGEAVALLAGDALLTEAFATVAAAGYPPDVTARMVRDLSRAAGASGMIAGQALDIGMGGRDWDLAAVEHLHRLKTGALIRASVRLGALAGGGGSLEALDTYADALGLAFQVHDDVLDAEQDADPDGPPSFVRLLGRDGASAAARDFADRAAACAERFPNGDALRLLARFTVERTV